MSERVLVQSADRRADEDLAAALIALAADPADVDWSPRAGGFLVPVEVAAAYSELLEATDPARTGDSTGGTETKPARKAAPRKAAKRAVRKKAEGGGGNG